MGLDLRGCGLFDVFRTNGLKYLAGTAFAKCCERHSSCIAGVPFMGSQLRIAIADDDRLCREFLQFMLLRLGHKVVCGAENGRQLADYCLESPPDVVITDVNMPELDGISAAAEINRCHDVPVILLSGSELPCLIEELSHVRVLVRRMKPFSRFDLEALLAEAMRASEVLVAAA
jgi:response regulator NasT